MCKLTLTFENVSMKQLFSVFVMFVFQWETERNTQLGEILTTLTFTLAILATIPKRYFRYAVDSILNWSKEIFLTQIECSLSKREIKAIFLSIQRHEYTS